MTLRKAEMSNNKQTKSDHSKVQQLTVVVRIRPLFEHEREKGAAKIAKKADNRGSTTSMGQCGSPKMIRGGGELSGGSSRLTNMYFPTRKRKNLEVNKVKKVNVRRRLEVIEVNVQLLIQKISPLIYFMPMPSAKFEYQ
ncbi:hypothetical protein CDAR_504171 [Caerostris darwini]|uniref:Kinesin motor domain-containing protein n=1 Tax=Caerostris darwini TaxID=1538125 RepID=A0AAV4S108_9ARAC|nr:hypothetical protein CDAR_504171 [Caerostris darwini]